MLIDILLISLIAIFLAAAFLFAILPLAVPGIILTIAAALIFVFWKGVAALGVFNLAVILTMGILYILLEWFGGVLGAKKFGGSKYGIFGAIVGGLLGIPFGGLTGVLLGTILGAAIFEMVFDRAQFKNALKVGVGAGAGFLLGAVGKIIIVAVATFIFLWGIWR